MHFNAGAILPLQIKRTSGVRQIIRALDKLLFPFSEEFVLKPYTEECDCIVESRNLYKKTDKRYEKPFPSCDACNGTGTMTTTYNKYACFDWWQIGGAWDGDLGADTPKASSIRRNCTLVRRLPRGYYLFAIVTPNGEWHEQWHFMAAKRSEKKEIALWEKFHDKLLKKYSKNLFVLIDCHR